jgi:hypothetical protein
VVVTRSYDTRNWFELADLAIDYLSRFQIEDDGDDQTDTNAKALENSRRIDDYFETARRFCVYELRAVFSPGRTEEQVREALARGREALHEAIFSKLERVAPAADQIVDIDGTVSEVNRIVNHGLTEHLPGVSFDQFNETELIQPIHFFNLPAVDGQKFTPPFVFLGQRLRLLCSYAPKLHDIIDGQGHGDNQQVLESLRTLWNDADHGRSVVGDQHLMERQLWRLLDLRDGGGFGLSVELFFLVLAKLLSMAQSQDTLSALYIGTFRSITSGWEKHKGSIGTKRVILNHVCDIAIYDRGIFSETKFPRNITTELLVLLENMTEGQSSSHFDDAILDAMRQLELVISYNDHRFFSKARELFSRLGARVPS